jgi:hypothetical protein
MLIALLVGDASHRAEVLRRFPLLNDKLYIEWTGDPAAVVKAIKRRIDADCAQ